MKQILYDDPNFLGNRLRALRLTFGFTQSSVAEVLGINRSTYSYYESGTTRPDPVVLGKLASYYQTRCGNVRAGGAFQVLRLYGAGAGAGCDGEMPYPSFYQQLSGRLGRSDERRNE